MLLAGWERYARGVHNRNLGIVSGEGLLSTEGEEWRTRRRQVQPAFRRECLERLVPVVAASVDPILQEWERRRGSGKPVPLGADMLRLTMRAMGRMLLSADIPEDQGARIGVILRDGLMLLRKRNTSLWAAPMWLPTPANRRLLGYRDELTEFVEAHLRARENGGASGSPDILARLLELRDPDTGAPLTRQQLIDETKTLFLAGFETTATALTWTLYLLARHPDAAAKLGAEVDAVLGGRRPSWEALSRLSYSTLVVPRGDAPLPARVRDRQAVRRRRRARRLCDREGHARPDLDLRRASRRPSGAPMPASSVPSASRAGTGRSAPICRSPPASTSASATISRWSRWPSRWR